MEMTGFIKADGKWVYFSPAHIAGLMPTEKDTTILYANGMEFELRDHIDLGKRDLEKASELSV